LDNLDANLLPLGYVWVSRFFPRCSERSQTDRGGAPPLSSACTGIPPPRSHEPVHGHTFVWPWFRFDFFLPFLVLFRNVGSTSMAASLCRCSDLLPVCVLHFPLLPLLFSLWFQIAPSPITFAGTGVLAFSPYPRPGALASGSPLSRRLPSKSVLVGFGLNDVPTRSR